MKYGQEETARHPVPEGKYIKVQCVHKSVPRIIEYEPCRDRKDQRDI